MSVRTLIGASVVVVIIGCGAAPAVAGIPTESSDPSLIGNCRDPSTDCTHTGGSGVYAAEHGEIGIDTFKFMITQFMNHGSSVTFLGRYFDAEGKQWLRLEHPGAIRAVYQGNQLGVTSVSETATVPTWTLSNGAAVTGRQLVDLKLRISFTTGTVAHSYVLEFDNPVEAPGNNTIHAYPLRWRSATGAAAPYCLAASDGVPEPDPVVFQQGIGVDPETGSVTRNPSTSGFVVLSCLRGALATAYGWGYPHRASSASPISPAYFDAAIQMKRASYCGDAHFYTVAGTPIHIADDQGVNDDPIARLEARWTPAGARCVNLENMRHPELNFTGVCNGRVLPPCAGTGGPLSNGL
jgi:hypothetical protein